MHLAHACPCCRSSELDVWPAIVSPFVAARALLRAPTRCRLQECRACGFRFFDARLDDDEVARLYDGYRDDRYFRERHRHEWWYTRRANERLGGDEAGVRGRRAALARFLAAHTDAATHARLRCEGRVLDYGGDRGQFIPEGLGRDRLVFDLSGVTPVEGVRAIRDEAELAGQRFDLVLLAHVLEHVSDPTAFLARLRALGRAPARLYVEVPLERPRLFGVLRGRAGEAWLELLLRAPRVLGAVDFYSTACRVGLGFVPPMGLAKAHEHLNFFEPRSLRALLESAGFSVDAVEATSGVIRALARFA